MIDHLLLSPNLVRRIDYVDIPHTYSSDLFVSDHWPVVVRLDLSLDGADMEPKTLAFGACANRTLNPGQMHLLALDRRMGRLLNGSCESLLSVSALGKVRVRLRAGGPPTTSVADQDDIRAVPAKERRYWVDACDAGAEPLVYAELVNQGEQSTVVATCWRGISTSPSPTPTPTPPVRKTAFVFVSGGRPN